MDGDITMLSLFLAAALALPAATPPGDDDLIWVEGEAAKTKDVSPPHGWYNSVKKLLTRLAILDRSREGNRPLPGMQSANPSETEPLGP